MLISILPSLLRLAPWAAVAAALLFCAVPLAAQPMGAPPGMAGGLATAVGVITMETQQVPFATTVPGRAVAYEQVDIRPRVGGIVSEIVYPPGRPVAVGDVLFRIEDRTYRAEVAAAKAEVALAEASVSTAQDTLARYEKLVGIGVTAEELATARVSLLQAEADLSAAEAALQVAELDLDRTEIKSPIAGFPEVPTVSVGALVTENQTDALTTITRIDAGSLRVGAGVDIRLELETGEAYAGQGKMVSPGASVSTTTGTTEIRLQFDNPERRILPGQFLRVDIVLGTTEAILVPQGATARAASGELTAFVAVDGKAEQRILTEQGSYQNAWIVTEGIAAGEALIVDGLLNLGDGAAVATVPVTISADGVVTETAPAATMDGG